MFWSNCTTTPLLSHKNLTKKSTHRQSSIERQTSNERYNLSTTAFLQQPRCKQPCSCSPKNMRMWRIPSMSMSTLEMSNFVWNKSKQNTSLLYHVKCLTTISSFSSCPLFRYVIPLDVQVAHYTPAIFPLIPMISPKINQLCRDSWKRIAMNKEMTEFRWGAFLLVTAPLIPQSILFYPQSPILQRNWIERHNVVLPRFLWETRCHGWKQKGECILVVVLTVSFSLTLVFIYYIRSKQSWVLIPPDRIKLRKRVPLSFVLSTMPCHLAITTNKLNSVCIHWAKPMRNVKFVLTCIPSLFKSCCTPFLHSWVPMRVKKVRDTLSFHLNTYLSKSSRHDFSMWSFSTVMEAWVNIFAFIMKSMLPLAIKGK